MTGVSEQDEVDRMPAGLTDMGHLQFCFGVARPNQLVDVGFTESDGAVGEADVGKQITPCKAHRLPGLQSEDVIDFGWCQQ